jgi:hypothetical protein
MQNYSYNDPRALDAAIAQRALHGNVTREQLAKLGLNRGHIAYRVSIGRLFIEYPGVYGVGRPAKTALERAAAAVLACGPGAALSHQAALALWGLGPWPSTMHVTVPSDRRPKGIKVHRPKGLIGRDFRKHLEIRVTSPARALLECAPVLTDKAVKRAYNDGRRSPQARLRPHHIADVIERFPHHAGAKRLRPLLAVKGGPTRSEWEDEFPAFCKRFGLPKPIMSTTVAGHEVDALFPNEKLIIELDSWLFHRDRDVFESDRDRDADNLAAGHHTVRITWERLKERPAREADRLHQIIRRWRAA